MRQKTNHIFDHDLVTGSIPEKKKKPIHTIQIDKADAATLNSARYADRDSRFTHSATTRVSRTTVSVPAATPNRRTEANTKVSETVSRAVIEGTLIVNDPVSSVRAASTNHSGPIGLMYSAMIECRMAAKPTNITVDT